MRKGATVTHSAMFESQQRGLALLRRGKVRDVYQPSDEHLIIVACDRISAFDHVLPTPITDKGKILTQISNFWFKKTEHIVANHIVDGNPGPQWYPELDWYYPELDGRTVLVRSTEPLVIEAIVRGYLSGSGWKEYQKQETICSIPLPGGLTESGRLPETIFTPSTKAQSGHDENISFEQAASLVGTETAAKVRDLSLAIYRFCADYALERGIIIADTKFEFGLLKSGELILIDEILTPDSSRFWPAESYKPGRPQASYDKQYVRDYLEAIKWNKEPPAPILPPEVVKNTSEKYWEAVNRLVSLEAAKK
jgi:phosphoribosylaminoimidazole-succinocarboxamide synthase